MSVIGRSTDLSAKEVHDILRNDRRRAVIKHLQGQLGEVSLRDLSERIAERESGESPAPRGLRESVYNSLHQTHLPKLDEREIIDYDRNRKTVELLEGARHVDVYMEVVTRYGITWATYYRSLGVIALLTVVLVNAGVPVFAGVPTLAVAIVFLVAFGVSTTYQLWSRRMYYLQSFLD